MKAQEYVDTYMTGINLDSEEQCIKQAKEMFARLVNKMAERKGITERLKAVNQMEWVGRMNNIRNRATEIYMANLQTYKMSLSA
jgi:hypothetical protein